MGSNSTVGRSTCRRTTTSSSRRRSVRSGSARRTRGRESGSAMTLSADELLSGGRSTHRFAVPATVLAPAGIPDAGDPDAVPEGATVVLRPLLLADLQRIHKA